MPDGRFYKTGTALAIDTALSLAVEQDDTATLAGRGDVSVVTRVATPDEPELNDAVVLCARKDIAAQLAERPFGLAIADEQFAGRISANGPVIKTSAAKLVFAVLAGRLHSPIENGATAPRLSDNALIHPTAIVSAGVEIGEGCKIGPYAVIGPGVKLGANCIVGAGASIYFALLGSRVRVLAGARLGEDGFGFAVGARGPMRIPQLGRLIIGDDVEIGANTTIDRGTLGDTVIGDGTKIDNLVHIAHNVEIGRNCFIAGQVGFAGSCKLGDGVMIGGQAGFSDHVSIGSGARIAAQAGLVRDVPAGESWGGTPAMPQREWLRASVWAQRQSKRNADKK